MTIFIFNVSKIIGATAIAISEQTNEFFIIWERDINQLIDVFLQVTLGAGQNIVIHHCHDTSDNVWKTETIAINPKISSQAITIIRENHNTLANISERVADYVDNAIADINNTINNIDTSITADKIMAFVENTAQSETYVFADGNKLYFQTNKLLYFTSKTFADFVVSGANTILSTTTIIGTPSAAQIASFTDYDTPIISIKPGANIFIQLCTFCAVRAVEYWMTLGGNEVKRFEYENKFCLELNTSDMDESFTKIIFDSNEIRVASPNFNNASYNSTSIGTTALPTIKYETTTFKIKLDGVVMMTVPLTQGRVQSVATITSLSDVEFYVNDRSFFFGVLTEQSKFYDFLTIDERHFLGTIINFQVPSDITDNQILPMYIINFSNEKTIGDTTIDIAYPAIMVGFTLRLTVNMGVPGKKIIFRDRNIPIATYVTQSTSIIETIDIECDIIRIKGGYELIMKIPSIIKNITLYDFAYVKGSTDKQTLFKPSTNTKVFTAQQYQSFAPYKPILLTATVDVGQTFIMENCKFYYLRGYYNYYSTASSTTPVYMTFFYANNAQIKLTINDIETDWTLVDLRRIAFQNVRPVGNRTMYPSSTSSTTNYIYATGNEPLHFRINERPIFNAENTNTFKDKIINWKRYVSFRDGFIISACSPDAKNSTIIDNSSSNTITIADTNTTIYIFPMRFLSARFRNILDFDINSLGAGVVFTKRIQFALNNNISENGLSSPNFRFYNNAGLNGSAYMTINSSLAGVSSLEGNQYYDALITFTHNGFYLGRDKWIINVVGSVKTW